MADEKLNTFLASSLGTTVNKAPSTVIPKPAQRQIEGSLDGIVGFFAQIDDPTLRMFAQGMVEAELSRPVSQGGLGFRVKFPDPQDLEIQALDRQIEISSKQKKISENTVLEARVAFAGLGPEALAALGVKGQEFDTLAEENTDLLLSIIREHTPVPLTIQDLTRAGSDTVFTEAEKQDKANKDLGRQVTTAKTQIEAADLIPEALDREREASKAQFEDAFDSNLGTGPFSEIDEKAESRQFAAHGVAVVEGSGFSPSHASKNFLKENGPNMADQLEGLRVDGSKYLIVGKGDIGIDDDATFFLSSTVLKMAQAQGTTAAEVFQQIGLSEYAGINIDSLFESAGKIAEAGGADPADVKGFRDAVAKVMEVGMGADWQAQIRVELEVQERAGAGG